MGRGRQKAKQTKVARELKYSSYEPNLSALERELRSGTGTVSDHSSDVAVVDEDDDWDEDER